MERITFIVTIFLATSVTMVSSKLIPKKKNEIKQNLQKDMTIKSGVGRTARDLDAACTASTRPLELTGTGGTIMSQNHPYEYDNDLKCEWRIKVDDGNRIKLSFVEFDVEDKSAGDFTDYLIVYDGGSSSSPNLYGKVLCGDDIPEDKESSGNKLYLTFITDDWDTYDGFEIKWSVITPTTTTPTTITPTTTTTNTTTPTTSLTTTLTTTTPSTTGDTDPCDGSPLNLTGTGGTIM